MKRVDLANSFNAMLVKAAYFSVLAIVAASYGFIYMKIKANKETGTVKIEKKMGTPREVIMSIPEYDMMELRKMFTQSLLGFALMLFLSRRFKVMQPLFVQSFMIPKTLLSAPLFKIYILGKPAVDKLARPFKVDNPFERLLGSAQPATASDAPSSTDTSSTESATPIEAKESKKSSK